MESFIKVRSSHDSAKFYDDIMGGKEKRGVLGKDRRFNAIRVSQMYSVRKYYLGVVKPYLNADDRVIDFGCGPGSFMLPIAPYCKEVIGIDLSQKFVDEANHAASKMGIANVKAVHITPDNLPFENDCFDVLIMVDVIHHLADIQKSLYEAFRVLKPGGRVLVYEPNKLNPLLALVCLLDRNEWGLLRLGTPWKYRRILAAHMTVQEINFNGIVIGPQSKISHLIAAVLNHHFVKPILGWLNPKMFIRGFKL